MPYCTSSDVQLAAGGADRLKELSDVETTGAINTANVTRAIDEADSWINGYLQRRSLLPLSPVPESVKRASAAQAVYILKRDRRMLTDDDKDLFEVRRQWLVDIANGVATVGAEPRPTDDAPSFSKTLEHDSDDEDDPTRKNLEGFW